MALALIAFAAPAILGRLVLALPAPRVVGLAPSGSAACARNASASVWLESATACLFKCLSLRGSLSANCRLNGLIPQLLVSTWIGAGLLANI